MHRVLIHHGDVQWMAQIVYVRCVQSVDGTLSIGIIQACTDSIQAGAYAGWHSRTCVRTGHDMNDTKRYSNERRKHRHSWCTSLEHISTDCAGTALQLMAE